MRLRIVLACVTLAIMLAPTGAPAETAVNVSKNGSVFSIEAVSTVAAPLETAWEVLADYESYPAFVPNLTVSRRIGDDPLRVEQRGDFRVLFFRREVHVQLQIDEQPPLRILFRAFAGNLKSLFTEVSLEPHDIGTLIRYKSTIEPDFWVPPLITSTILRFEFRGKLEAVADEIMRRTAGAKAAP
ncbi:MAG: SRPBCC family protein [Burkholderiales bacterium]